MQEADFSWHSFILPIFDLRPISVYLLGFISAVLEVVKFFDSRLLSIHLSTVNSSRQISPSGSGRWQRQTNFHHYRFDLGTAAPSVNDQRHWWIGGQRAIAYGIVEAHWRCNKDLGDERVQAHFGQCQKVQIPEDPLLV